MTKTDLINIALREMRKPPRNIERINSCKAFIVESTPNFYIIVSYHMPVAVYVKLTGTMYVFDFYSATTQQHIRKAADILEPIRITYLYRRYNGFVEIARNSLVINYYANRKEWENIISSDYSLIIGERSILSALEM